MASIVGFASLIKVMIHSELGPKMAQIWWSLKVPIRPEKSEIRLQVPESPSLGPFLSNCIN